MAKYTIATIGGTEEAKRYFEQAQAELSSFDLDSNNTVKFIDLTEMDSKSIQSLGTITSVMYFTDIHDSSNHNEVLPAVLKRLPEISDLSVFALSHNEVTENEQLQEQEKILGYVKDKFPQLTAADIPVFPVNINSEKEMKAFINGFIKPDVISFSDFVGDIEKVTEEKTKAIVDLVMTAIDEKHDYTAGHVQRVSKYVEQFVDELDFTSEEKKQAILSAKLHDIGKLGVPYEILASDRALSNEERDQIDYHSSMGAGLLKFAVYHDENLESVITKNVIEGIEGHHDKGEGAHKFASVIAVADCIDAMTSQRAYNAPKHVLACFRDLYFNSHVKKENPQFAKAPAKAAIISLGKNLASLGYSPLDMFSNLDNQREAQVDAGIRQIFEDYESEHGKFEIGKNPDGKAFCAMGFRLTEDGHLEFRDEGSPIYDKEASFQSEFAFQKGKFAKDKGISVDKLSMQEESELAQKASSILKAQSEEGKKALQNARSYKRSIPSEVLEATSEDPEYNLSGCTEMTRGTQQAVREETTPVQENSFEK